MRRLSFGIVLLLISTAAMANLLPVTSSTTDMSMKYLGEIFGAVPGAFQGSGTTLISGLFDVFNKGVMAVAVVWLVYTIFQLVILSAVFDAPQKNLKNWAIHLRVVAGFALLIPTPSGYNIAQEVMMQAVKAGVHLADECWSYVLNYLEDGQLVFIPPQRSNTYLQKMTSLSTVQSELSSYIGSANDNNVSKTMDYELFEDEVYMDLSNVLIHNVSALQKKFGGVNYHMVLVPPSFHSGSTPDVGSGVIYFPGFPCSMDTMPAWKPSEGQVSNPWDNTKANGNYGEMGIADVSAAKDHEMAANEAFKALQQAAMDMEPLAQSVANYVGASLQGGSVNISPKAIASVLSTTVLDYLQLMQPVANLAQTHVQSPSFLAQADKEGWFNAGAFYWDIIRLNNDEAVASSMASPVTYVPASLETPKAMQASANVMAVKSNLTTSMSHLDDQIWHDTQVDILQVARGVTTGVNSNDNPDPTSAGNGGGDLGASTSALGLFDPFIAPLVDLIKIVVMLSTHTMANYNPLLICHKIGIQTLSIAGSIWFELVLFLLPMSIVAGVCDAANPGGVIMQQVGHVVVPFALGAAAMLFTAGVTMVFYIPLYPCLVFMFGVIGWLLAVAEAMVAAPLVCFGMTHPEGHDFLGSAQQALMLALSVFLRPALIVIGYVFGLLLVYVCSGFLNYVLGQVFVSTFSVGAAYGSTAMSMTSAAFSSALPILHGGGGIGGMIAYFLCIPVILVIYAMIMVEVANQCFSAIYQIPNMVMRWIGGPVGNDNPAQQLAAIKGAADTAANNVGSSMNKLGEGEFKAATVEKPSSDGASGNATKTPDGGSAGGSDVHLAS